MIITTGVFRLPADKYFKILFILFLRRKIVWIFFIAVILSVALWWNFDFFYLLLILIFLVSPFLLMIKYFEYIAYPQNRWNILDKYLIIDEKEIVLHFTDKSLDRVLWSDICFFKMRKAAFLLYTDKSHFIYIPKDAFGLNEEYLYFYRHMLMKINSKEV